MATTREPPEIRTFCLILLYTGCRLSEARNLRRRDLQFKEGVLSIGTLKRREAGHVREIPIPEDLALDLQLTHFCGRADESQHLFSQDLQPPSRTTSYRWVKRVMVRAGITGLRASPKGLRHGFGVYATQMGIQLHMLQKWMGHASMKTTAIYATALGPEEKIVASHMW